MRNKNDFVSVVMPAYHCSATICRALDSVLAQSVPLEVIVINDCSNDDLDQVMEAYEKDPRIVYIHNETNIGAAASRNKGVQLARGEYIAFLDSDDWWEKDKLEKQLQVIKKENVVLCSTARELVTPEGELTGRVIEVKEKITYGSILLGNPINCSSVLLRADVAREFPMEHEDSHEDYITWIRILKKYERAAAINEPLLKYRLSNSGKSGNKLQSARMTYKVYYYSGFHRLPSVFLFCAYAVNGLLKYGKAYINKNTGK